jgi:hypothetical protein
MVEVTEQAMKRSRLFAVRVDRCAWEELAANLLEPELQELTRVPTIVFSDVQRAPKGIGLLVEVAQMDSQPRLAPERSEQAWDRRDNGVILLLDQESELPV